MSTRDLREFLLSRLVCVRQHVYRPFQSYSWPSLLICSTTERRGAGIDDDQLGARAQTLLQTRGEHRMPVGWIGADDDRDVSVLDGIEILRSRRSAECRLETIAGGRMADPGAGIDIVVAEAGAHQLLHQEGLFVRAARRGDAADRRPAV